MAAFDTLPDSLKPLPALRTHGCVVLIDDDLDYVSTLEVLLASTSYSTFAFHNPAALHEFMGERVAALAEEQRILADIWRAQVEGSGTVATAALRFFARPRRFDIPLVLVSDYAMPAETGISVCSRYHHDGLERVLLTGVADDAVAVSAFNSGVIEQFVLKQSPNLTQSIIGAVEGRLHASASRRASHLASKLAPALVELFARPAINVALRGLLRAHGVREYMMLADPQGLVGITGRSQAVWIQLETENSLADLQEVLELAGADLALRRRIRQRESLVALDWMKQLGAAATETAAIVLSKDPVLVAAIHPLGLPPSLVPSAPTRR